MKKMLMVATVPSMIGQFNMNNIDTLLDMGVEVQVACNFNDRSVWTTERVDQFVAELEKRHIAYHQIDFARNPLKLNATFKAKKQLLKLAKEQGYDFIHCHTPAAGLVSRMVGHKLKIKVIYTAHGFHFYEGAPIINWLVFYPIEKFFSRWTDTLITINREDLSLAQRKFHAKKYGYIPGVGVPIEKFALDLTKEQIADKRRELGIPEDAILVTSVGELNDNKNHGTIVRALAQIHDEKVHYAIAGKGDNGPKLMEIAEELGIENRVHVLGFRKDIAEIYAVSDICAFPSIREGLGLAALEAMAAGLPIVVSKNRGAKDFAEDGVNGFVCDTMDSHQFAEAIGKLLDENLRKQMGQVNREKVQEFSVEQTNKKMEEVYRPLSQA